MSYLADRWERILPKTYLNRCILDYFGDNYVMERWANQIGDITVLDQSLARNISTLYYK